jgi:hypothetical protein
LSRMNWVWNAHSFSPNDLNEETWVSELAQLQVGSNKAAKFDLKFAVLGYNLLTGYDYGLEASADDIP